MLAEKMKQRLQPYVDGDMASFRMQVLLASASGTALTICGPSLAQNGASRTC
jgi:hypothetical protein